MMRRYIGYHGTSQQAAESILLDSAKPNFQPSTGDDQWLGDGVYFFEDDVDAAKWWVTGVKNFSQWVIIEARIAVEEEELFNLVTEGHRKILDHALAHIEGQLRRQGRQLKKPRDAEAINLICTAIHPAFKVVRAAFSDWETRYSRRKLSRVRVTQIQLVVRSTGSDCLSQGAAVRTSQREVTT